LPSISHRLPELEKLLEKWFEKKYPDNMVITAYPIIE
jgi:hypothetical protein